MASQSPQSKPTYQSFRQGLYNSATFSDATFKLQDGRIIPAHSIIISHLSPALKDLYESNQPDYYWRTNPEPIPLTDWDSDLATTMIKHLYAYPLPQEKLANPSFVRALLAIAKHYRIATLESETLQLFSKYIDSIWGQPQFIDLIATLYDPTEEAPQFDLRVRVADCAAKHMRQFTANEDPTLQRAVDDLLEGFPDFGEDFLVAGMD